LLQSGIYDDGRYLNVNASFDDLTEVQHQNGLSEAVGINGIAADNYASLKALPEITDSSMGETGAFLMLYNCTAHDTMLYQEPEYEPSMKVDNTEYDMLHADRFSVDGISMDVKDGRQMSHYQSNMATMLMLGNWFDHLRKLGVYDNTRIILVADHGLDLGNFDELITEDGLDIMRYNPLLMVKDFNEKGFHRDNTFMTNADTPTLAFTGIINEPVNPFTGKAVSDEAKHSGEQHIMTIGGSNQVNENNGTMFQPGQWYALRGENALNRDNWSYIGKH
jgi:arylsulfatase A-like enzyme